jgi:hypothetical protein
MCVQKKNECYDVCDGIVVNCFLRRKYLNTYPQFLEPTEQSVTPSYWIALNEKRLSVCMCTKNLQNMNMRKYRQGKFLRKTSYNFEYITRIIHADWNYKMRIDRQAEHS